MLFLLYIYPPKTNAIAIAFPVLAGLIPFTNTLLVLEPMLTVAVVMLENKLIVPVVTFVVIVAVPPVLLPLIVMVLF